MAMFIRYNGNPCGKNTEDCVIRAISIATGFSRHKVYASLCAFGFECTIWGNNNAIWSDYLQHIGFIRHKSRRMTVSEFAKFHPHGTFVIGTRSHAVAIIDGDYIDSWNSGSEIVRYYFEKE